jgi:hypothetical protein
MADLARPQLSGHYHPIARLSSSTTHTTRLRVSAVLFRLSKYSGQQFVLRPQQELDCAKPLHHVLKYIVYFTFSSEVAQAAGRVLAIIAQPM